MTDEQIETALNACMFGQTKADRCKDCPLDSEKEPCITNLHLAALGYVERLKAENSALRQGKKAAVEDVAERIKMAFYYEFDELIPSIMADKIDELVEEVCGDGD